MKIDKPVLTFLKMVGMVICAAIIGMFMLWAVYLLPSEPMAKNVASSAYTLKALDDSQYLLDQEYWKAYDRGTNIIILHEVIYPNTENALRDALLAPTANYIAYWTEDWSDVLIDYATNREYGEFDYDSYARYWHGYLVYLKPLFMFMDLQGVNVLNAIVLTVLTVIIAYLMNKRLGKCWIAYVLAVLVMHPINMVQSFQLSTVFYAMQITMLLLLLRDKWKKEQLLYIFVIDGILVAFLDFLTYPFVAFGIPVLTCFLLYREEKFKDNFINIILNGISFAVGYAGMWGMKWLLATILTDENVIMDAIYSVLHRTGVAEDSADSVFMSISAKDALVRNLSSFFNEQNLMILVVTLIGGILFLIVKKPSLRSNIQALIFYLIMAIAPFMWIVLLTNHCSLHPHLEWRTFSVLVYAVVLLVISVFSVKTNLEKGSDE